MFPLEAAFLNVRMRRLGTFLAINALERFVMGTICPSKDFRHWQMRCHGPYPRANVQVCKEKWLCPTWVSLDSLPGKVKDVTAYLAFMGWTNSLEK